MSGPALMPDTEAPVAGWYGKIPALGDFASRRLSEEFIKTWDPWLQRALVESRSALRERWQNFYLNSPIWRFVLLPGVCGNSCWTGIMMPSVDKVGRHFPLTIALALEPQPEIITTVFASQSWFASIEQIALSSLNMDFSVDDLEKGLTTTPFSNHCPLDHPERNAARELAAWWSSRPGTVPLAFNLPDPEALTGVLGTGALNILFACGFGKSLWWTCNELAGTWQLQVFCGLPPEEHFATLLADEALSES